MKPKIHVGDFIAENGKTYDFTEISGWLAVPANCTAKFPNLQTVGGYVWLRKGAKLDAGNLHTVGGYVCLRDGAKLAAGKLQNVGGFVEIGDGAKLAACKLQTVGGNVYLDDGAKLTAGNLQNVGGYVWLREGAKLAACKLQTVGGNVYLDDGAKLTAGNLQTVGGDVYLREGAKMDAPNAKQNCGKQAIFAAFKKQGYHFADGILAKIVRSKGKVAKVVIVGNQAESYVVEDGKGNYSHGATLAEARRGLIFKLTSHDTTFCKDWKPSTVVSFADAVKAYRAITGSCEGGVRNFCEGKQIADKLTVADIVKMTEGSYGADKFRKFFEVSK